MSKTGSAGKIGILVGGGPAPGINGVISSATIEARNNGLEVIGIPNGFENIMVGNTDFAHPLYIKTVSRIHLTGGSILNTSRANPTQKKESLNAVIASLKKLDISALITIGGDDTARSVAALWKAAKNFLRVAHVPKTIDNDLPLPHLLCTFGYETARHYGVNMVRNLMTDARATPRWYLVIAMGRSTGHLTLGIGKAAGTTLAIIPEEFGPDMHQTIALKEVADIIETTIIKRHISGHPYGVVIIAEGIGGRLDPHEFERATYDGVERDEHGHVRLAEVNLGRVLRHAVRQRFLKRGQKPTIIMKNLGYELRCADPIPFDLEYTRDLGFWAVRYLIDQAPGTSQGAMISLDQDKLTPMAFEDFIDPQTGRPRIRCVDIQGESYHVARKYMIYLEKADLKKPKMLRLMAEMAQITPEEFCRRYGYLTQRFS